MFKKCLNSFARKSQCKFSTDAAKIHKLGILGVPFSKGQGKSGVEQTPDLMRKNGIIELMKTMAPGKMFILFYFKV